MTFAGAGTPLDPAAHVRHSVNLWVCRLWYRLSYSQKEVESNVSTLKDGERRLLIAGLATLAIFASFLLGAVFFAILLGLGMNEDLAWGMSVLLWIAVVASGIVGLIYFYDSIKKRVEHFTAMRSVTSPPPQQVATVEPDSQPTKDQPSLPPTPRTSYRSMLLEGDRKDEERS